MSKILAEIKVIVNNVFKNSTDIVPEMKLLDVDGVNSLNIVLLFVELEKCFKVDFPLDFDPVYFSDLIEFLEN